MTKPAMEQVRIRVVIDCDMPDAYEYLSNTKHPNREAVHLIRLGILWKQLMGEGGQQAILAISGAHSGSATSNAKSADDDPTNHSNNKIVKIRTGADLALETGITADYFMPPSSALKAA